MRRFLILTIVAACAAIAPATAGARPLYFNLYNDSKVDSFAVGADGVPALNAGFPMTVGGYPQSLTVSPDGRFMVVQFPFFGQDFLQAYSLDGNGGVTPVGGTVASPTYSYITFAPDGKHLYAPLDAGGMEAYSFSDGAITPLGAAGSDFGVVPVVTPDGRFVFATDSTNAQILRYAVQANGTLTELTPAPALENQQEDARITPDGRFLVLVTEAAPNGHVSSYAIGADGSLTPTGSSVTYAGAVARRSPMTPDGRFMFVLNQNTSSISTVAVSSTGVLTKPVADTPPIIGGWIDGAVSADGKFLFAFTDNGMHLEPFAIGADGSLTAFGSPIGTGGASDGSTPVGQPAQPPKASLVVSAHGPGEPSKFTAVGAADSDGGTVTGYKWDFGDGATSTTSSATTTHKYAKAGVFAASVAPVDNEGCSPDGAFDGQVTLCNKGVRGTATVDTPPAITKLKLSRKKIAPGQLMKIKYRLSEKARVSLTIQRIKGKKKKTVGSFRVNGRNGANSTKFKGKLKGKALFAGKYQVVLVAKDKKGKSTPKSARFSVR